MRYGYDKSTHRLLSTYATYRPFLAGPEPSITTYLLTSSACLIQSVRHAKPVRVAPCSTRQVTATSPCPALNTSFLGVSRQHDVPSLATPSLDRSTCRPRPHTVQIPPHRLVNSCPARIGSVRLSWPIAVLPPPSPPGSTRPVRLYLAPVMTRLRDTS